MSASSDRPKGHVRRIVTGHDERGRSCITEDRAAPTVHTNPKRVGYVMTQLWITDDTPAPINNGADPTLRPVKLEPPPRGSVVRIIEFGPEGDWLERIDASGTREAWGALGTHTASTNTQGKARHPFMHRTESVDYALVLEGEITLVLDNEEVLMREGDFLVVRGTNHAWANRSGKPCRMLFVLIGGEFDSSISRHFGAIAH